MGEPPNATHLLPRLCPLEREEGGGKEEKKQRNSHLWIFLPQTDSLLVAPQPAGLEPDWQLDKNTNSY